MTDLIAKLESAPGNDPAIFEQIGRWAERNIEEFSLFRWHQLCAVGAFTEAALTLVPEGYRVLDITSHENGNTWVSLTKAPPVFDTEAATPALALSAAALKAHEAKHGGQACLTMIG